MLKSTFILSLFYIFYKIFLQKDTFFQSIRFYFLIGIISSMFIPFIVIKKYIFVEPVIIPSINNLNINQAQIIPEPSYSWDKVLFMVYTLGVILFLAKFLIQLTSLLWFLYKNPKQRKGNFTFVETQKDINPFSFFNYIIVNRTAFKEYELTQIIAHEKTHATQFHSIDNLLVHFLTIFHWFNPLAWLYSIEIQKNLEFIADAHAQNISSKNKNYQHLLLKTVSLHSQMALTTNFYNSLIKKRINMLQKNRSSKIMQFKFTLIIPALIAFVFTFNTKVIAQNKDEWEIEIKTDRVDFFENITKDFNKTDLEKLRTRLAAQDISFKYKKLKYNSNNEITGISISVKDKNGNQTNFSQKSGQPIKPILINISSKGTLTIGNASEIQNTHNVLFVGDPNKNNNVHFNSSDKGAWHSDNNVKVISGEKNNSYVIVTGENDKNKTITVTVDDDKNIQFGNSKNENISVWASDENDTPTLSMGGNKKKSYTYTIKRVGGEDDIHIGQKLSSDSGSKTIFISDGKENGNSTKIREVKVIEIGDDGSHKVIMKSDKSNDKNIFIIKTDDDINASQHKNENKMYISSKGEKLLFIIDGKETNEDILNDMTPDKIQSINVLKGEAAIKKYGNKGKNGVIEISTKESKIIIRDKNGKQPLFILDGKEMKDKSAEDLDPNKIKLMNVLKGEKAIKKYGDKGKNGVIEITTKK